MQVHGSGPKVWDMAHHCQAPHGHGIATSVVHMGIILELSVSLPCVKSPVSRTPWKNTWIEFDRASVVTTKGWKVQRERVRECE